MASLISTGITIFSRFYHDILGDFINDFIGDFIGDCIRAILNVDDHTVACRGWVMACPCASTDA